MGLSEAIKIADLLFRGCIEQEWKDEGVEAFRVVIEAARRQLDDTQEIALPPSREWEAYTQQPPILLTEAK